MYTTKLLSKDEREKFPIANCIPLDGSVACAVAHQVDYTDLPFPVGESTHITLPADYSTKLTEGFCSITKTTHNRGTYIQPTECIINISNTHPFVKNGKLCALYNLEVYSEKDKKWYSITRDNWINLELSDNVNIREIDAIAELEITVDLNSVLSRISSFSGIKHTVVFMQEAINTNVNDISWEYNMPNIQMFGIYKATIPPVKVSDIEGYMWCLVDTEYEKTLDIDIDKPIIEDNEIFESIPEVDMVENQKQVEEPLTVVELGATTNEVAEIPLDVMNVEEDLVVDEFISESEEDIELPYSVTPVVEDVEVTIGSLSKKKMEEDGYYKNLVSTLEKEINAVNTLVAHTELLEVKLNNSITEFKVSTDKINEQLELLQQVSIDDVSEDIGLSVDEDINLLKDQYNELVNAISKLNTADNPDSSKYRLLEQDNTTIKAFNIKYAITGNSCNLITLFSQGAENGDYIEIVNLTNHKVSVNFGECPLVVPGESAEMGSGTLDPRDSLKCLKYNNILLYLN